jgi:hypothetical protein
MAEVIVSHVWSDGASTQIIVKSKAYPDSFETLEDIATRAVAAFTATVAEMTEVDPAEVEAD